MINGSSGDIGGVIKNEEIERTIDDLIKLAHDISERWTPQKE
jgi:hypothetical protein